MTTRSDRYKAEARFDLGMDAKKEGNLISAISYFTAATKYDNTHILAFEELGNCYILFAEKNRERGGLKSERIQYFREAAYIFAGLVKMYPKNKGYWFSKAVAELGEGEICESLKSLSVIISADKGLDTENAQAWMCAARGYRRKQNHAYMKYCLERVFDYSNKKDIDTLSEAHLLMGDLCLSQNNIEGAEKHYNNAIQINPRLLKLEKVKSRLSAVKARKRPRGVPARIPVPEPELEWDDEEEPKAKPVSIDWGPEWDDALLKKAGVTDFDFDIIVYSKKWPELTRKEVRSRFGEAYKQCHPDKSVQLDAEIERSTEYTKLINEAKEHFNYYFDLKEGRD